MNDCIRWVHAEKWSRRRVYAELTQTSNNKYILISMRQSNPYLPPPIQEKGRLDGREFCLLVNLLLFSSKLNFKRSKTTQNIVFLFLLRYYIGTWYIFYLFMITYWFYPHNSFPFSKK